MADFAGRSCGALPQLLASKAIKERATYFITIVLELEYL
jgi:hypothetical protein